LRNRIVVSALTCALLSGGAVAAFAVPASQTTLDFQVKPNIADAGTPKKPKNATLKLAINGGTTTGEGQPATSKGLNIVLPANWRLNSERWPQGKRCSITQVNQDKSTKSCPSGSKVGEGRVIAEGAEGAIERTLFVTAFVIKNGDLGFFIQNKPGESPTINEMIQGATSKGYKINIKIPATIQEPIEGVPTGINELSFTLKGTTRIKGKTTSIVQNIGCARKKWKFTLVNIYRDGKNTDTDTVNCKA
jgi:hypothetical protein